VDNNASDVEIDERARENARSPTPRNHFLRTAHYAFSYAVQMFLRLHEILEYDCSLALFQKCCREKQLILFWISSIE
jgi:hypothetical protein